jgi:phospholipid/cholesterol/gamma-HCH transport system substrate-binding protein
MSAPAEPTPAQERWLFLGSGLVLVSALLLALAREQHWGQPMQRLQLSSRHAGGLRAGQEVRISGMPVGKVTGLQLLPDARVAVQLQVERRYAALIGPKSAARQNQDGLVGDQYLEISPDPQPAGRGFNLAGHSIRYEQPVALATLLNKVLETQQELQATLRNTRRLTASDLPETLRQARRSLVGVDGLSATLRRETAATAPELRRGLVETRQSLAGVNRLSGSLQRETAATAPELRRGLQQLSRTGSNAEQTLKQAQQLLLEARQLLRQLNGLFGAEGPKSP